MNTLRHAGVVVLLFAAIGANAQVHRCGDSNVYTDKPCDGAEAVDLRSNVLQAGPTTAPQAPAAQPAPPLILHDVSRVVTTPAAPPSSVWQNKDANDAAQTSRTTGQFPR